MPGTELSRYAQSWGNQWGQFPCLHGAKSRVEKTDIQPNNCEYLCVKLQLPHKILKIEICDAMKAYDGDT